MVEGVGLEPRPVDGTGTIRATIGGDPEPCDGLDERARSVATLNLAV